MVFRFLWVGLLYVLVSSAVLHAFMEKWGFRGDASFGLESLLDHTTYKPFVYRVLSPILIRQVSDAIPASVVDRLKPFVLEESNLLEYRRDGESWGIEKAIHFHVAYGYLFLCLLVAMLMARRLVRFAADSSPLMEDLAPAITLLFLPLTFHLGGYLYDFPELAFIFGAVVCIFEKRFWLFYVVFVLAILNKESNVLLAGLFFAVLYRQISNKALIGHLSLQVVIGTLLLFAVRYHFRDVSGRGAEFHLFENLHFWFSPRAYVGVLEGYAPLIPLPQGLNIVTLFLATTILYFGWRRASVNIRLLLVVSLVMNIPLMVVFGYLDEIRILSLSFPAFFLIACHAIPTIYAVGDRPRTGNTVPER